MKDDEKSIEELEAEYATALKKRTESINMENDEKPIPSVVSKIPTATEIKIGGSEGNYDFDGWYEKATMMEFSDSDTGCEAIIDSWSPLDNYARIIWQQVVAKADLFQCCVKGLDIKAGDGLGVQIRTIGSYGSPTATAACECVSCVSAPLSTYSLNVVQLGLVTELCSLDIFDIGGEYPISAAKAMGISFAKDFNARIYAAFAGAAPTVSVDMANTFSCSPSIISTSCCIDQSLYDFYNAVNQVVYELREDEYDPDYIIVSPSVAAVLKRMQQPAVQAWAADVVKIDAAGKLSSFNGLKCVEYFGAQTCSTATDTIFGIVLDSKRAAGAAFGKRPSLEKDRNIDCNSWTYAMWAYFATDTLDDDAIGFVKSPDA